MATYPEDDDDERAQELSTLQAIFPDELILEPNTPYFASIDIPVAPQNPLAVRFPVPTEGVPNVPSAGDIHTLSFLPPLHLEIFLPEGYPSENPPQINLSTSPAWLPSQILRSLEKVAVAEWEECDHYQVLFTYITYLQEAAERSFNLAEDAGEPVDLPPAIKTAVLDYNTGMKREKFAKETFDCGVCLEPKKGSACYRMEHCQHVFCVDCLQNFYNNCITEGDVNRVQCLSPDCGKERGSGKKKKSDRLLTPKELLQIPLERPMVQRYVNIKRKKKMEADKSTIYCPRKWCQGAARSKKYPKITDLALVEESDSEAEDETSEQKTEEPAETKKGAKNSDRLAVCEDCNFAFCNVCLAGWHGEFVRCWPRNPSELTQEEQASMNYILSNTTPCPSCDVPCQKSHGCNHMSCFQCKTHFCYLCSSWLDPSEPYQHFNTVGKPCYQRLFELEEGDEGNGNVQFDGIRGAEAAALRHEQEAMELQRREFEAGAR